MSGFVAGMLQTVLLYNQSAEFYQYTQPAVLASFLLILFTVVIALFCFAVAISVFACTCRIQVLNKKYVKQAIKRKRFDFVGVQI